MSSDSHKETDSLLRAYTQRDKHGSHGSAAFSEQTMSKGMDHQTTAVAHLDADELNAYAEDAVPAATRSRYTAHLADCERCRKIATALVLDVVDATEPELHTAPQKTSPALSAGERLADVFKSFFTPRALGFALPILLALFGVAIGILFIAKQSRQSEPLVSSRSDEAEMRSVAFTNANSSMVPTEETGPSASANQAEIAPVPDAPKTTRSADRSVQQKASEANVTERPATTPVELPSTPNKPAPAVLAGTAAPPPNAETSEDRAQRLPRVDSEETKRITELPINKRSSTQADTASSVSDNEQVSVEAPKAGPAKLEAVTGSTATSPTPAEGQDADSVSPRRRATSRATSKAPVVALKQDNESIARAPTEIRRIGNRQFRRGLDQQRRQWIDTTYKSSIRTINIARGSESYRALLADEPELRRIIEQLDGEIVVVWKNRAYHVR